MTQKIVYAGLTNKGRIRQQNEDRWFADPVMGLYVVSDGIGGGFAGGLAAQIVVDALPPLIRNRTKLVDTLSGHHAIKRVSSALVDLSARIRSQSKDQPGLDGMGATVVLAMVRSDQVLVAHLGDSRAYLCRQRQLERLTKDHSLLQTLLDIGQITPDETISHPARQQLTRFVGMPQRALPEARVVSLSPGDKLLLCSDGLTSMVSDNDIQVILNEAKTSFQACKRLVMAANQAGGQDNITTLVIPIK